MSKICIDWAKVEGFKADFVKNEVKITLRLSLEAGLAIRSDLSEMAEGDMPVIVEIQPLQDRLPMLDKFAESVRDGTVAIGSGE